jgi:anti-anti-sigma regulatory factor
MRDGGKMEIIETVVEVESEALISVVVLEVSGDCSEEAEPRNLYDQLIADPDRKYYIVDLKNALVNSTCLGMLIAAVKRLREAGDGDVRLLAPALKPLYYGHGDPVFKVFSSRDEALESYRQSTTSNSGCLSTVLLWLLAITILEYAW